MTWLLFDGADYYPEPCGQDLAAVCDTREQAIAAGDGLDGDWQVVFEVEPPAMATERWHRWRRYGASGGPFSPWKHERPRFITGSEYVDWEHA